MPPTDSEERSPFPFETALWFTVAAAVVATALAVSPGSFDIFRTPKTVVFQLLALLIFAAGATAMLLSERVARAFRANRTALLMAVAAVVWTAIASMTSLKPAVSLPDTFSVFCYAVFFIAAVWTSRERGPSAVAVALAPAVVNAVAAFMQSFGKWTLWFVPVELEQRLRTTGFIGTANESGGYLVIPLIAAIAAAIAWPRLRWVFGIAAAVIAVGVVAAQSVTSIGAAACGVASMVLLPGARRVRWAAAIGVILFICAVALHPGSRARMKTMVSYAEGGQLAEMTSFRLPAYTVALAMFRDRPLLGVGPGVFRALYLPYKLEMDAEYPQWIRIGHQTFGLVHNDHLQLLAETGLPGYLLFLAAMFFVARLSFTRRDDPSPRARFVTAYAFPGVAALFVLALAHFPLQLTSHVVPALYLAAVCIAWKDPDASN